MKDRNSPETGVITNGDERYTFYLNDYLCTVMRNTIVDINPSSIQCENGFVKGRTYGGREILLYIGGKDYNIPNVITIPTSMYIISSWDVGEIDFSCFDGIRFYGGSIIKVFQPEALQLHPEKEIWRAEQVDDSRSFSFCADEYNVNVTFCSTVTVRKHDMGEAIENGEVFCTLTFDKSIPFNEFFSLYWKFRTVLSFLIFRENIAFDKIELIHSNRSIHADPSAQVFIREESGTQKSFYECIHIEDVLPVCPQLFKMVFCQDERKQTVSLGFLPDTDNDVFTMTNHKLRSICAAVECELGQINDIESDEKAHIDELIAKIRSVIIQHQNGENPLREETYNAILSSLGNFSLPAKVKFQTLFHRYEHEMKMLSVRGKKVGDKEIEAMIRYRNDITHGRFRTLTSEIAYTASLMAGLVYCCIFSRLGLSHEQIKVLCRERLLR